VESAPPQSEWNKDGEGELDEQDFLIGLALVLTRWCERRRTPSGCCTESETTTVDPNGTSGQAPRLRDDKQQWHPALEIDRSIG